MANKMVRASEVQLHGFYIIDLKSRFDGMPDQRIATCVVGFTPDGKGKFRIMELPFGWEPNKLDKFDFILDHGRDAMVEEISREEALKRRFDCIQKLKAISDRNMVAKFNQMKEAGPYGRR